MSQSVDSYFYYIWGPKVWYSNVKVVFLLLETTSLNLYRLFFYIQASYTRKTRFDTSLYFFPNVQTGYVRNHTMSL